MISNLTPPKKTETPKDFTNYKLDGGFIQPLWKISVKMGTSSPKYGMQIQKSLSCHQPDKHLTLAYELTNDSSGPLPTGHQRLCHFASAFSSHLPGFWLWQQQTHKPSPHLADWAASRWQGEVWSQVVIAVPAVFIGWWWNAWQITVEDGQFLFHVSEFCVGNCGKRSLFLKWAVF